MSIHRWDLSPAEAIALQQQLAAQVSQNNQLKQVETIAGVDMSVRGQAGRAAVAVFSFPDLVMIDHAVATRTLSFPYLPGLFSFREGPVVLAALERLADPPDLLIFDGQGLAHPRRFGLACHIGLLTGLPSIGCAKSRLIGQYQEPGPERGSYSPLIEDGQTIGAVVRTRSRVKPVFVSIGHRVDLPTSIHYVLACCGRYRLPEPIRWADRIAGGGQPPAQAKLRNEN